MSVEYLASGDTGLTVQFGFDIDRGLNRRILALRLAVDEAAVPGVIETVPTYRSLLVHYDPLKVSQADLIDTLRHLTEQLEDIPEARTTRYTLPICCDEAFASDLGAVCAFSSKTPDEVAATLTSVELFIYMLGFAPGMPYMGDLPPDLALPRKKVPAKTVEKGSVLIATGLTVIYPAVNPSGWHIVGRCPVPIFDLNKADPVLLSPGDRVRFRSVDRHEFDAIEALVVEGLYAPEKESDA